MSLVPITKEAFYDKRWAKHKNYWFAKHKAIAEVSLAELPKAAISYTTGFLKQGDMYMYVALMGIEPAQNLYIDKNGNFLANYIPAFIRISPFALALASTGEKVICVDESIIYANDGEAFFEPDGSLSESLKKARDFLSALDASISQTHKAINAIEHFGLIKPWDIQLTLKSGTKRIEGIYCIDETVLNALDADALKSLRDAGALALAYCQLISMQNIEILAKLADYNEEQNRDEFSRIKKDELDFSFLN
ncbi:MAG: SapC family protein [Candidatus Micrarchaeaceae archaeon]